MTPTTDVRPSYRTVRAGPIGLVAEGLRDIWSRRRLARYLVQADLTKKGADTLLGNVWWVLDPLLQMLVYVIFVTIVAGVRTADYPLFIFCAILPWKWFSSSINDAISSVTSRERIIKQVKFPKIILPVASTAGGIVNFAFGLIPLVGLIVAFYPARLSATILLIPLIAVVQLVFTLSIAVALGAINVFYRDVGNVSRHFLRIWFYLSPALYSVEQLRTIAQDSPALSTVLLLNPFAVMFEAYRDAIYRGVVPAWDQLGIVLIVSLGLLGLAVLFFKRVEPSFAKIL